MKNVKMKLIALMLIVVMAFTGCMSEKMEININSDGSGKAKATISLDKAEINQLLKKQGATDTMIETYWKQLLKEYKEMGMDFKDVTIDGKEYLQYTVSQNLRKGKLAEDLGLSDNSYITVDTFYSEVDMSEAMPDASDLGEYASLAGSVDMSAIKIDIVVTMPKDIVSTNGVISASDKKTVNFSVPINKKATLFATTKGGVTQAAVQKKVKAANTIAKPKLKKVKANKVKKNAKKATITVKWGKVKTAKKYEVTVATNKKMTKNITVKATKKNKVTIKKLKKNKKYYVEVVAIKNNFAGIEVRSKAAKKSVKTKK